MSYVYREQEDDSDSSEGCTTPHKSVLPVHCIGRQEGSTVFVLGPDLQFWKTGEAIPPGEQQYVWIPYILKKLKVLDSVSPLTVIPQVLNPVSKVLRGLKNICGDNFGSSLFLLGEYMYYGIDIKFIFSVHKPHTCMTGLMLYAILLQEVL